MLIWISIISLTIIIACLIAKLYNVMNNSKLYDYTTSIIIMVITTISFFLSTTSLTTMAADYAQSYTTIGELTIATTNTQLGGFIFLLVLFLTIFEILYMLGYIAKFTGRGRLKWTKK